MRRIKLIVALGVVMAAMLALSAGPAVADEWNDWDGIDWNGCGEWNGCDDDNFDDSFDEVIWLAESSSWYDQLCSPGLPEGVWIPGCIFSDPIEEEHVFDDAVFVIDDIDFKDIDFDDDHFRKDDRRFHDDDWRFRGDW
jgi:hypothetical protein